MNYTLARILIWRCLCRQYDAHSGMDVIERADPAQLAIYTALEQADEIQRGFVWTDCYVHVSTWSLLTAMRAEYST